MVGTTVKATSTRKRFVIQEFWRYVIIISLPLLLLEMLVLCIVYREIKSEIVSENQRLPGQIETVLADMQQNVNSINAYFSQNSNIGNAAKSMLKKRALNADVMDSMDAINYYLQNIQNMDSSIYSVYIYYNNDYERFFDSRSTICKMYGFYDNSWYAEYLNSSEDFWYYRHSIQRYDFSEKVPVITACRALYSELSTESDGLVVVNYWADKLEKEIGKLALYENQTIVLLDQDGELLLQSREMKLDELLAQIAAPSGEALSVAKNGPFGMVLGGKKQVVSVIPLPDQNITALSLVPFEELYGQMLMVMKVMCLSLIAVLLLSTALAWISASREVRRLNEVIALLNHELKSGQVKRPEKPERSSVYDYILFNVLGIFMEQDYLKVQYSERKYRMEMLELQALQHQINPHFINNTLNGIYWKAIQLSGGPNICTQMLEKLSAIMKYAMESSATVVTVQEEKNYLDIYLEMQNERYGGKLKLQWDVDREAYDAGIPKLLLQPLIENAIYHGINEKLMQGKMKCCIRKREGYLYFSVIDTGMGVTREKLGEIRSKLLEREEVGNHVGLYNTNLRLILRYGEDACISFYSKYQAGTLIRFRIPYVIK